MSSNVVAQRLVNATNILFHLLELQPYALVLPMDCKTASRNKRKIMNKIMANNGDIAVMFNKNQPNANQNVNNTTKTQHDDTKQTDVKRALDAHFTSSNIDAKKGHEDSTSLETQKGAVKTRKRTGGDRFLDEVTCAQLALTMDYSIPANDISSPFFSVNNIIERLDSEDMKGCIIMLADRNDSTAGVTPLAGGIIEIIDAHERSIQALWFNRSLEERMDIKILLKTLVLRIFAHAYQMNLSPNKSAKNNKLVSIYQSMLIAFPRESITFIEKDMLLSKHYEANNIAVTHNDSPKVPCKCHRAAAEATEFYYGISETRFNNLYMSVYETILFESIGQLTPILQMYPKGAINDAEKIDHITKAVREIEKSLKDPNVSKKIRKA
ncbi:hypothetical protein BBOV_III000370 [Babesia bovis T2Bo]|uniref:Uncharacterized protein n=1 Tax=Babesia bovis TaxID=5865 RepID=A7AM20_BABBO|nr:hypothetical protein BBOV_III000370 [Babesia bovis T2Bo]EDO07604.1 hypothetical protein BBOV_III000370 [Babesia bovis T2Bo]|eukprot:XP_001611172.1 hypothetical protein [Babesia bovis T2Bo]